MAEAANTGDGSYEIEWPNKPLGFSIVMDTTGNNAYVSSIQKQKNVELGLKLAAQIIGVNGDDVKGMQHGKILEKIKSAGSPIKLRFQPRSFANNPDNKFAGIPSFLRFKGAKANPHRVNGSFKLITESSGLPEGPVRNNGPMVNDEPVWIHVEENITEDTTKNPIYCWFWPAGADNNPGKVPMWMISRGSHINTGSAYACVSVKATRKDSKAYMPKPTEVTSEWDVWNPDAPNEKTNKKGNFVKSEIQIDVSST